MQDRKDGGIVEKVGPGDSPTSKVIGRDQIIFTFSGQSRPALEVTPGQIVTFETLDASGGLIHTSEDAVTVFPPRGRTCPATGPLAVQGARPGDTMVVEILDIRLALYGFTRTRVKPPKGRKVSPWFNILPGSRTKWYCSPIPSAFLSARWWG